MRRPLLAVTLLTFSACRDHGARAPDPSARARDSIRAPAPVAPTGPSPAHGSELFTAVFEDEVERTPRAPTRAPEATPAPKPPVDLSRITSSLASQLSDRGGIQWSSEPSTAVERLPGDAAGRRPRGRAFRDRADLRDDVRRERNSSTA